MIILSKRNVIIPSDDGKVKRFIPKDYVGKVEAWVTKTEYFKALVGDGKIVVSDTTKDKDVEKAATKKVVDNAQKNVKKGTDVEEQAE